MLLFYHIVRDEVTNLEDGSNDANIPKMLIFYESNLSLALEWNKPLI